MGAAKRPTARPGRSTKRKFPPGVLSLFEESRMLAVRAGDGDHRPTGIWFVLVGERLFVRPWNDGANGWRRELLRNPTGAVVIGGREIKIRARTVRSEAVFDAVDAAYAAKYDTKASLRWVRGLRTARRRRTTMELLPR